MQRKVIWALSSAVGLFVLPFAGCGDDGNDESTFEGGSGGTAGKAGGGSGGSAATGGTLVGGAGGSGAGGTGTGGTGAGDSGAGDSAGANCGDYGDDADCKMCLANNCCTETAACEASAECKALVACVRECPDPSDGQGECPQACLADHPDSFTTYNGIVLCMGMDCADQCRHP